MNAVDTNILIYARDPRYPAKHQKARDLTSGMPDGGLLWQVACEFIAASRKLTDVGYTQTQAWRELEQLRRLWKVILPSEDCPASSRAISSNSKSFVLGFTAGGRLHRRRSNSPLHRRF